MPPPTSYLKLNVDARFKERAMAMAILVREEHGLVKGLWLKKAKFAFALATEAKAIYNVCIIAKEQAYLKVLIESDCKIIIDTVLGYSTCSWAINATVEDIKIFLDDYPYISLYWIVD